MGKYDKFKPEVGQKIQYNDYVCIVESITFGPIVNFDMIYDLEDDILFEPPISGVVDLDLGDLQIALERGNAKLLDDGVVRAIKRLKDR